MINVNCLNNIASVGLDLFSSDYNTNAAYEDAQAVLVRSAKMHDMELSDDLLAIARAGAGVNNIPLDKCADKGIVVFNTPGANANAVKEHVLAALLLEIFLAVSSGLKIIRMMQILQSQQKRLRKHLQVRKSRVRSLVLSDLVLSDS